MRVQSRAAQPQAPAFNEQPVDCVGLRRQPDRHLAAAYPVAANQDAHAACCSSVKLMLRKLLVSAATMVQWAAACLTHHVHADSGNASAWHASLVARPGALAASREGGLHRSVL